MIFVYSVILLILLILCVIFFKYKKVLKDNISLKENPLSVFYGLSFFIVDFVSSITSKLKKSNSPEILSYEKKKLLMLNPGKDVSKLTYLTFAKRLSICIFVVIMFMFFGLVYSVNHLNKSTETVTELIRPTDGSDSTTYSLQVNTEDETEYIDIEVSKKMYEYSEIISLFDKYRNELVETMLGDNPSTDNISLSLNFIDCIGEENIRLGWNPENTSYIDFNGNLISENLSSEGTPTSIYVSMEFEDVTASLVIGVTLYPPAENTVSSLNSEIQNYIDANSNPHSTSVELPKEISKGSVSFSYPTESSGYIFLILALLSAILLYILSSKETDNLIKKRNQQLMHDYPEIVSKLLLLCSAGLNIHNALKKITEDYKTSDSESRYAYEELSITINSLENGKPESTAYSDYGKRCGLLPYIKLGALLEQNLHKGSKELRFHLNNEVQNAFENHKSDTITLSKQAETKLLFPMILMLVIVMALIMVPSFLNI